MRQKCFISVERESPDSVCVMWCLCDSRTKYNCRLFVSKWLISEEYDIGILEYESVLPGLIVWVYPRIIVLLYKYSHKIMYVHVYMYVHIAFIVILYACSCHSNIRLVIMPHPLHLGCLPWPPCNQCSFVYCGQVMWKTSHPSPN